MNFYEILKTKKLGRGSPDYWTQLFAEHVGGKGEWKIAELTGPLPLTFTTSETALRSWTLHGAHMRHTITYPPIMDYPAQIFAGAAGAADTWTIYGNDENGTENVFDGNYQAAFVNPNGQRYRALDDGRTAVIQCDPNTQYTISLWSGYNRLVVGEFETEPQINDTTNILADYATTIPQYITIITGTNAHYIACYVSNQNNTPTISIVKGSTAPDHYIPYQQGVGERTKNKFQVTASTQTITDVTFTVNVANGSVTASGTAEANRDFFIQGADKKPIANINSGDTLKCYDLAQGGVLFLAFYDSNGSYISQISVTSARPSTTVTIPANAVTYRFYIRKQAGVSEDITFYPLLALTAPQTYIPYGYKIPLTVSQDGQTDKTYDIYIGDSPLTEGETVSKASTGVDIELFEGISTVSTTLTNKPRLDLTVFDYYGIASRVNLGYQVKLKVTHNGSTRVIDIPVPNSMDEGDTVTDINLIPTEIGENTISLNWDTYPTTTMTIKYVGDTELTGMLPITFRSNGTALIDYRVFGTADGAGVQTENLLSFTNGTKTSNNVSAVCAYGSYTITIGEGETVFTELNFDIPPVTFPISVGAGGMGILSLFNTKKNGISICFKNSGTIVQRFELNSENRVFNDYTDLGGATINRISFRVQAKTAAGSLTVKPMLTDDSAISTTYIPYGYKLPLTVTSGTESKDTDIYIGDSKLLSGDYVDYESRKIVRNGTPQDPPLPLPAIETFKGTNTLDSTETLGEVTIKGQIKPQS